MRNTYFALAMTGFLFGVASTTAEASLKATRRDDRKIEVQGDHFRLTVDASRGGQITSIVLFDGAQWNQVLGADGQTCPAVTLSDAAGQYMLANDAEAKLGPIETTPEFVRFEVTGMPKTTDGKAGPWTVKLGYEIHPEGAVFVDLDYTLPEGDVTLAGADLSFDVDRAVVKAVHYCAEKQISKRYPGFRTARVAFGVNPKRSYTNEVEAVVEYRKPICEKVEYEVVERRSGTAQQYEERRPIGVGAELDKPAGRFQWILASRPFKLQGPFRYHNRFALGLGSGVAGAARSTMVGQRIYQWVNFLDKKNWYPTNEQIDKMAANGATVMVLFKHWMSVPGSNGFNPASYEAANETECRRAISHAHARGLRVGFYMRGCEAYGLGFFKKYGKRDWDGIYMDWHGLLSQARHEQMFDPGPAGIDRHISEDGNHLPAREYFAFTKRCRAAVGPKGFLIGHQGPFNSGVLSNLAFDAYLPGEWREDWGMFAGDVHRATYVGMCGGGICMPWTLTSSYRTPRGIAKMAVWGFYPHAILAYETKPDMQVLLADPTAEINRWVLPYWRLLAAIDVEKATVHNLPNVNLVAAESSDPSVQCLVYKEEPDTYLVLVGNLGKEAAQAEITLVPGVLGMKGTYQISHVDSATGKLTPRGTCTDKLSTSKLPQWGIEAFKLGKK